MMNGVGGLAMRFSILDIWADGYERIAHIRLINSESEFFVSFIEHDEYINSGKSIKRTAGTQIEGNLQIEFVNDFSSSDEKPFYCQNIPQSPFIQAVVDVIEVIDNFSIRANLSGYAVPITTEFERRIPKLLSERILIYGELRIDIGL